MQISGLFKLFKNSDFWCKISFLKLKIYFHRKVAVFDVNLFSFAKNYNFLKNNCFLKVKIYLSWKNIFFRIDLFLLKSIHNFFVCFILTQVFFLVFLKIHLLQWLEWSAMCSGKKGISRGNQLSLNLDSNIVSLMVIYTAENE